MSASPQFRELVAELLSALGPVRVRRMFGGAGVFLHDVMFGLISADTLYLKVDDVSRPAYERESMAPFAYESKGKTVVLHYWSVPDRLYDDDADELIGWARQAYDVALKARTATGRVAD